ncbi:hypothetical protein [Mailhella massiliensis]|uniref:hypothetical protein n=1 Tax=Mailhella massiliensis TaxID=1903261 RepID=UPI0023F4A8F7|nr:hypothetical protein [Mailhella massiliensis]
MQYREDGGRVSEVRRLGHAELQAFLDERCREPGLTNCDIYDLEAAAACSVIMASHGSARGENCLLRAKDEALFPLSGVFSVCDVAYVITVLRVSDENLGMNDFSAAVDDVEAKVRAMAAGDNGIRGFLFLLSLTEEGDAAMVDIILTGEAAA